MTNLSLNDLLTVSPKVTPVEVPEWSRRAYVRRLNARDRIVFNGWYGDPDNIPADIILRVAAICLSQEDGTPFFEEGWEKGVDILANLDSAIVDRIALAGYDANDLSEAKKKSSETDTSKT